MKQKRKPDTACKGMGIILLAGVVVGMLMNQLERRGTFKAAAQAACGHMIALLPYAPLVLLTVAVAPAMIVMHRTQKMLEAWDGEDEAVADRAEYQVSLGNAMTAACMPLAILIQATSIFYSENSLISFLIFLELAVVVALAMVGQKKSIRLNNLLHPENPLLSGDEASIKQYVRQMDEGERHRLGEAAWNAFQVTTSACYIIDLLLLLLHAAFDVGILPIVVTTVILLVNLVSFTVADYRNMKQNRV